jgi:hypothetical protein
MLPELLLYLLTGTQPKEEPRSIENAYYQQLLTLKYPHSLTALGSLFDIRGDALSTYWYDPEK